MSTPYNQDQGLDEEQDLGVHYDDDGKTKPMYIEEGYENEEDQDGNHHKDEEQAQEGDYNNDVAHHCNVCLLNKSDAADD